MSEDEKSGEPVTQLGYTESLSNTGPDSDAPTAIHPPPTLQTPDNRKADAHRQRLEELVRRATHTPTEPPASLNQAPIPLKPNRQKRHRSKPSASATSPATESFVPTSTSMSAVSANVATLKLALTVGFGVTLGGLAALHLDRVLHPPVNASMCGSEAALEVPVASGQHVDSPARPAVAVEPAVVPHRVVPHAVVNALQGAAQSRPADKVPLVAREGASKVSVSRDQSAAAPSAGFGETVSPVNTDQGRQREPSIGHKGAVRSPTAHTLSALVPELGLGGQDSAAITGLAPDSDVHAWDATFPSQACSDPSRLQIPTQLHPRVNPLMTSGQVFAKP